MSKKCPGILLKNYPKGLLKHNALKLIGELITKNAIEKVPETKPVVFNRVLLSEKPIKLKKSPQVFRLIIGITKINQHLKLKNSKWKRLHTYGGQSRLVRWLPALTSPTLAITYQSD